MDIAIDMYKRLYSHIIIGDVQVHHLRIVLKDIETFCKLGNILEESGWLKIATSSDTEQQTDQQQIIKDILKRRQQELDSFEKERKQVQIFLGFVSEIQKGKVMLS